MTQSRRFLCIGAGDGWHADQLLQAAHRRGIQLHLGRYESLCAHIDSRGCQLACDTVPIEQFDGILTRTMPMGSMEQVTMRLAVLHAIADGIAMQPPIPIVNPPRSLEWAIDKFATLARVAALGYEVPRTHVVQSRGEAMEAFETLGSDCVVKPIFGGEGRGVMRIRDRELAWTTFSTLAQLNSIFYVQSFVPPGGQDIRMLVIGDDVIGIRRTNEMDFRTNRKHGGIACNHAVSSEQSDMAQHICRTLGLCLATVDMVQCDDGVPRIVEVNSIPGWKGAQQVTSFVIADAILSLLDQRVTQITGAGC